MYDDKGKFHSCIHHHYHHYHHYHHHNNAGHNHFYNSDDHYSHYFDNRNYHNSAYHSHPTNYNNYYHSYCSDNTPQPSTQHYHNNTAHSGRWWPAGASSPFSQKPTHQKLCDEKKALPPKAAAADIEAMKATLTPAAEISCSLAAIVKNDFCATAPAAASVALVADQLAPANADSVDAVAEALAAKILDFDLTPLPEDSQAIIEQIDILQNSYNYIVGNFKREPPYLRGGILKHMQNDHAIAVQTLSNHREKILHIYICIYVCMLIYIYTYAYTLTYIYICTYVIQIFLLCV